MGLALFATVALAKIVVDRRIAARREWAGEESISGWPFSFRLPPQRHWTLREDPAGLLANEDDLDSGAVVVYTGDSAWFGRSSLIIGYQRFDERISPQDAWTALFNHEPRKVEEISLATLSGIMQVRSIPEGRTRMRALACGADGLVVFLIYVSPERNNDGLAVFDTICRSIELRERLRE